MDNSCLPCSKPALNDMSPLRTYREGYVSAEDLPNEMLSEILSYLDKKERLYISTVNQRWFQIINSQIEGLESIRRPTTTENLEELQNLINRFPNIRSLSLANRINNLSELVPLKSLAFKDFSLEFDVCGCGYGSRVKRVKLDFENLEYNPSQIIHYEVQPRSWRVAEMEEVMEEMMSLTSLKRIRIYGSGVISRQVMDAILTRPNLRQIDFHLYTRLYGNPTLTFASNIDPEFQKNFTVEEITLGSSNNPFPYKFWKQLFNALPNTKRVRVVFYNSIHGPLNILEFLKILCDLKNLKSLHLAMSLKFYSVQQIQECCKVIANFPIKAKVVIADMNVRNLSNLIEKDEGKPPKIVSSQSCYPLSGSSFLPKQM